MVRLLVHVEGETEERFVNEVLGPHLLGLGLELVSARLIGNARLRAQRGGIKPWNTTRRDIVRHLKGDAGSVATTMVDFYGLPSSGDKAWPGRAQASSLSLLQKCATIEKALLDDLAHEMGPNFDKGRFVPYVVMHEFEGLLFSECALFAGAIERPDLAPAFQAIRSTFSSPEEINDSPTTAPSKRVTALLPSYQKPLLGTSAAKSIGLVRIRANCPCFDNWVSRLEALI